MLTIALLVFAAHIVAWMILPGVRRTGHAGAELHKAPYLGTKVALSTGEALE